MSEISKLLQNKIKGSIKTDNETLDLYSHDASMFELRPEMVVEPQNYEDICNVVRFVNKNRQHNKNLSITVRSGGTCMSGGAIGQSIILDVSKHLNKIFSVDSRTGHAQPGVYYRDFEKETLKHGVIMPSYPASREICTIGGMVSNNAGGEKSLQYGKTEKFIKELKVIFSDGNEYTVKPLNKSELKAKMAQNNFEGDLYRQVFELIESNYDAIKSARPKVSKDSTGYHLWDVWDRKTGIFDLTQLLVGSQGTLGIVTDIKFKLVPTPSNSGTLVVFMRKINNLGEVINKVLEHKPATFEGFDNYTLMLSFKLFYYFHQTLGWWGMIKLAFQLIPDALKLFRGIPKMVLLVEFNGKTPEEVQQKVHNMRLALQEYGHDSLFEEDETEQKAKKFWIMRRESFNLLRKKVHDKHTAPYIDDMVVLPQYLSEFLPKLRKIITKYKLLATITGHMGDGNFHVIPLMKFEDKKERDTIAPSMKEVNELILEYGGSLSGEHNDGLSRGPWLSKMYPSDIYAHFKKIKQIFDQDNIFNPHKKTDSDWDFSMSHIRKNF